MSIPIFSGKDLVSRSAAQIKYFRDHPEEKGREITPGMIRGSEYQEAVTNILGGMKEMKSDLTYNNIRICCCHDLVNRYEKTITEIKHVDKTRDIPEWYFQQSILQCVLYKTIYHYSGGVLTTPKFMIDQGYEAQTFVMSLSKYQLLFGDKLYEIIINPDNYIDIIRYFEIKALYSLKSYDTAKSYDAIHYKHHFEDLRQYFDYQLIKSIKI
jgi:hypothetical protein